MRYFVLICSVVFVLFAASSGTAYGGWQGPVMISDGTGGWHYPRVEVSGDYVHVVWRHISGSGIRYRRSTDGGTTWNPIQTLISGYASDPTIAVRDGFVHVVFNMGTSDIKYCRSTNNGASFAAAINLPTSGQGSDGAQVATSGNFVYVAWAPSQDILFMQSTDNGVSWGAPTNVTNDGGTNWEYDIRLASSGASAYLAWRTTSAPNTFVHFRRGTSNGTNWSSAPITLWTGIIDDFDYISISADQSNVYVDRDDATIGPAQRVSTDSGVTWGGTIGLGGGTSRQPRVDGSAAYPSNGANVYIRSSNLYVSTGLATETLIGTVGGSSPSADIAANSSGDMHVVCNSRNTDYEIYYYRSGTGIVIIPPPPGFTYIPNVPDWNQPPFSGSSNYCAPTAALNIVDYWQSGVFPLIDSLVNPADAPLYPNTPSTADTIGYFMGTNGSGCPRRINQGIWPGTHFIDQRDGLVEYIAWNTAGQFGPDPSEPPVPAWKVGYSDTNVALHMGSASALWNSYVPEIDSTWPAKIDFTFWNPLCSDTAFIDPVTQDTVFVYQWGPYTPGSGPPNPEEEWDGDIGHAVTGVGYIPNWNGTDWAVVHDNWPTTDVHIAIPWQNLMAMITAQPPTDTGQSPLVGHWRFDEGSGSTAYDETDNHNDGTIRGASWIDDFFGGICTSLSRSALHFHGGGQFHDGDRVLVPHSSSIDITGEFAVSAWIKATGTDHYLGIVDKYNGGGALSYGFTLFLTGGKLRLAVYSGSNGSIDNCVGTTDLRDNDLHLVTGVWDGSYARVYVDGKQETEIPWTFPPASTSNSLGIGERPYGWGGYMPFLGGIDEVRLYDQSLGATDVELLYCNVFRGDANGSRAIDIDDVVYLIIYIFAGGPAPDPLCTGDADCSGAVDIDDVVFLINYIFAGGPEPCASCDDKAFGKIVVGEAVLSISTTSAEQVNTVSHSIAADREVQALQLDFEVCGDVRSVKVESLTDGIQEFHGQFDGLLKIGLLDLRGQVMIPSDGSEIATVSYVGNGELHLINTIAVAKGGGRLLTSVNRSAIDQLIPRAYSLEQNFPNPFNPTTEIAFSLKSAAQVRLSVYNILGQEVKTLIDDYRPAGSHTVTWESNDDNGEPVASGLYFYRIKANDFIESKKMLLLK